MAARNFKRDLGLLIEATQRDQSGGKARFHPISRVSAHGLCAVAPASKGALFPNQTLTSSGSFTSTYLPALGVLQHGAAFCEAAKRLLQFPSSDLLGSCC